MVYTISVEEKLVQPSDCDTPVESAALLATVRRELARTRGERPANAAALDHQLQVACAQWSERALAGSDPDEVLSALTAAADLDELRSELRERDLYERLEVLARIRESMEVLRECTTPDELIEMAPGELCRACGFSRAMISRIRGSNWVPEVYEGLADLDPTDELFKEWIEHAQKPLEHLLVETEMVRRRRAILIDDAPGDPRTWSELIERGQTKAYVAAPIVPDGRPIGFLHADKVGQSPVTVEDRDNLGAFAEQFGLVYHRAVLAERLDLQRTRLREAFEATEALVAELRRAELAIARPADDVQRPQSGALLRPPDSRLEALLTRREREVLQLMSTGASNLRIARELVVSEGTVKSHVRHVLRKLRASNRAEAVVRYLHLVRREQELSGR